MHDTSLDAHLGTAAWVETLRVDGELLLGRVAGQADRDWQGRPVHQLDPRARRRLRAGRCLDEEGLLGLIVGQPAAPAAAIRRLRLLPPPSRASEQWVVDADGAVLEGTAPPPAGDLQAVVRDGRGQLGAYHVVAQALRSWPDGRPTGRYVVCTRPAERAPATPLTLTDIQQSVATYAATGATIAQIAAAIGRSEETVKSHLYAVYRRLEVANRAELARVMHPVDAPAPGGDTPLAASAAGR